MAHLMLTTVVIAGLLFIGCVILSVDCIEVDYTNITIIGDNNSYQTLNPNATFDVFDKIRHVKGSIKLWKGGRITGDRLLYNLYDSEQFSKAENVQVFFRYPNTGEGQVITYVEILADPDPTAPDAFTGFVTGLGGINDITFQMVLQCQQTANFGYEMFMYGY